MGGSQSLLLLNPERSGSTTCVYMALHVNPNININRVDHSFNPILIEFEIIYLAGLHRISLSCEEVIAEFELDLPAITPVVIVSLLSTERQPLSDNNLPNDVSS